MSSMLRGKPEKINQNLQPLSLLLFSSFSVLVVFVDVIFVLAVFVVFDLVVIVFYVIVTLCCCFTDFYLFFLMKIKTQRLQKTDQRNLRQGSRRHLFSFPSKLKVRQLPFHRLIVYKVNIFLIS